MSDQLLQRTYVSMIRRAGLLAILFFVAGCSMFGDDFDEQNDERFLKLFDQSVDIWEKQGIDSYEYAYTVREGSDVRGPITVTVAEGEIEKATILGNPIPVDNENVRTIEEQFNLVKQAFEVRDKRFSAQFDGEQGYPLYLIANYPQGTITELQVHSSQFNPQG